MKKIEKNIKNFIFEKEKNQKYLMKNKIECVIILNGKIVYAYGKNVEKYINFEISDYLNKIVNDKHLESIRSDNLEIVKNVFIKKVFYYKSFDEAGCIILFFGQSNCKAAYNFLTQL